VSDQQDLGLGDAHPRIVELADDWNETAQALLDATVTRLESSTWDAVNVGEILTECHVSRSSLYHYFGSRQGLLAAASSERYRRMLLAENLATIDEAAACTTEDEFLAFVEGQVTRIVTDPMTREVRRVRLVALADALQHDAVMARLVEAQRLLLDAVAQIIRDARQRGLVNPELDVDAYSAWLHSMTLGRTTTEESFPDTQRWLAVAIPAALAPLRTPR